MSKNRRIALQHAVALAIHESIRAQEVVSTATSLVGFLDDLPTLNVEAGSTLEYGAHYESQLSAVLNHPVAGFRKKNAEVLTECLAQVAPLSVNDVLQAGPGYLFDLDVSEKRRGKILEDLYAIADAHEVELSDVEAYACVVSSLWSNGHEDYLFNGDAAAIAPTAIPAADLLGTPTFKEAVVKQREEAAKPKCGCPNHTPFTAEELPTVRIDQLDVHPAAVEWLLSKGVTNVQELRNAGPAIIADLNEHDQSVLASFALALEDKAEPKSDRDGYLDLPIDSFADINLSVLDDLRSKGVNTLRDLFENPLLIPACMVHGMSNWLKLTSHLLTGLSKELEARTDLSPADRQVLEAKIVQMNHMMALAKNMVVDREVEDKLKHITGRFNLGAGMSGRRLSDLLAGLTAGKMGQPLVIEGDSPEGQALLQMLRSRSGNPEATSGVVKVDSETDPAFSSLIDALFGPGKKEPTKH